MKIANVVLNMVLLGGGLFPTVALSNSSLNQESDAMQITTHLKHLTGIACDSTGQSCISIGIEPNATGENHLAYKTINGGISWNSGVILTHPENEDDIDSLESIGKFTTIRCDSSTQNCLIAGTTRVSGQNVIYTYTSQDGGQTWSLPQTISFGDQGSQASLLDEFPFLRLNCDAHMQSCILATNLIIGNKSNPILFTSQNGGENWSSGTLLSLPSDASHGVIFSDLACDQSGLFCTAITQHTAYNGFEEDKLFIPNHSAYVYSTHDGGITWSDAKPLMLTQENNQSAIPSRHDVPTLLSCDQSGLSCIALGLYYDLQQSDNTTTLISNNSHVYLTKNGGLNWTDSSEILANDPKLSPIFTALHCDITNRFCAAVGIEIDEEHDDEFKPIIYTSIDSGHSWMRKTFTPPDNKISMLLDIFCSEDAALCHAVGLSLTNPKG